MTEALIDPVVFNPYDYHFHDDPYPTYKRLREESPLYHNPDVGFWALSRYADVVDGFKDNKRLSSAKRSITRPRCIRSTRALCDVVSRYG